MHANAPLMLCKHILCSMIRVIALLFLYLYSTAAFQLEVEDTATARTANVWGSLLLVKYSLDNKLSLILEGAHLGQVGESTLSLDEIDIMHEIDHQVHRFEPENMKVLPKNERQLPMITLSYQSKKSDNWIYRFHFSPQQQEKITAISEFILAHQNEEHIDLFALVPEHMREQLEEEQRLAVEQLKASRQATSSSTSQL